MSINRTPTLANGTPGSAEGVNPVADTVCSFCHDEASRAIIANHHTPDGWVRVTVCQDPACREQVAQAPRQPRQPRRTVKRQPAMIDGGGWFFAAQLSGTSKKSRTPTRKG